MFYDTRRGLGFIGPVAAGAGAGPVGLAIGGIITGLMAVFGGGVSTVQQKLNAFQENPTPETAVDARDYLAYMLDSLPPAKQEGQYGYGIPGQDPATDLAPAILQEIANIDQWISQQQNYQFDPADPEANPEQTPGYDPNDPDSLPDGGTIIVDVPGTALPGGSSYPPGGSTTSVIPLIGIGAGASLIPILGGGSGGGAMSESIPGQDGGSSWNPFSPSGSGAYGFLWKLLPGLFNNGDDPREQAAGDCDCSGKQPNWIAWAAAGVSVYWAMQQGGGRRYRRRARRAVRRGRG